MRQWIIADYGVENLRINSVSTPIPQPGEVLVKVEAVSLNYRDYLVVNSGMGMDLTLPIVPCSDLSGIIVDIGENVTRFKIGDRVISTNIAGWINGIAPDPKVAPSLGGPGPGVLSEYVSFSQDWFSSAPLSLTTLESSTLPCAALTAWIAVVERGKVQNGDFVVVQGTGGVSLFASQFANAFGANVIITSSDNNKIQKALSNGAKYGINRLINPYWDKDVMQITGGKGANLILEMAGGENFQKSLNSIAQEGKIAIVGLLDSPQLNASVFRLFSTRSTLIGIGVGSRKSLEEMIRQIDILKIRPVIDRVYKFDEVPEAFKHLGKGAFGKIVIQID
ncbi:zinc-dependent alcohol dehydrogenase family protein [Dysgonomonas gadei]|uniref:Enoyl reductase (ER) domain-containing protein n=1 Tax=Dysgonomonas gadei ATCC BAA-286 TaxID=742766 RepID=F5J289_9BACT|nr:NAD(P)-dependent alcohol dehydrogenase [Dysgonomonas gadei]EGK00209.1 hypothetical protein HMPREF9455_03348 [Dysgonomonas gadei ATCC BAA-286]